MEDSCDDDTVVHDGSDLQEIFGDAKFFTFEWVFGQFVYLSFFKNKFTTCLSYIAPIIFEF